MPQSKLGEIQNESFLNHNKVSSLNEFVAVEVLEAQIVKKNLVIVSFRIKLTLYWKQNVPKNANEIMNSVKEILH